MRDKHGMNTSVIDRWLLWINSYVIYSKNGKKQYEVRIVLIEQAMIWA
ncbi:hypothetical protein GTQ34_01810 [Muricauda sp. JGD-17]|uniref:Uncharacterized protein n=1 Tax=Flagellimonas ochracea TaxID=2696472 RepID=A0A964WW44_9FLAO|nr:hypothetical protein [Allomuricauda ochracea]NAY90641.1 hypothetical protein [Allomuricauda ochracea]